MKDTGERLIPEGNEQTLTYGEHISRYVSVVDAIKDKNVLDVASGSGYGSRYMAEFASSVQGLDYSEEAVEYARLKYPAKNLAYSHGDAESMPFDDDSFDVVVSFETIEHLNDPDVFIAEVKRVLRADGIFIVSTPNDDEFMDDNEFHLHEFQFDEMHEIVNANFKNHKYYYQGTFFAAGLFDETIFGRKNLNIDAQVGVTFQTHPEKAIYFLAVASNSDQALPSLRHNVILADRWSTKNDIERDRERNADRARIINDRDAYRTESEKLRSELETVKRTKVWKLVSRGQHIKHRFLTKRGK